MPVAESIVVVGAVVSWTVTRNEPSASLPASSVAVQSTVVWAIAKVESDRGVADDGRIRI